MPIDAIESPTFQPAMRIISAITNANPASLTTSFDHDYLTGMIVRLEIPNGFGMTQADQLIGSIIVTGATTFTMNIDTTQFDVFAVPGGATQQAQVLPVGEISSTLLASTRNVLPTGDF